MKPHGLGTPRDVEGLVGLAKSKSLVYIYIYIYTYTHVYMYIYIYIYIHTMNASVYKYISKQTHTYIDR